MKEKWQIVLSGVGGQGLIACGSIIAEASAIHEDKNATITSSYGIETRGTFSKSDIIISEKEIYFPEVLQADVVLSLAQVAYDRYVDNLDENALLVYDSEEITEEKASKAKQHGHAFTSIARELGNVAAANMVALGVILKHTGMISEEAVYKAIESKYGDKPKVTEINVNAVKKGMEIA